MTSLSDWRIRKDPVHLIAVFHDQKKPMAAADIGKNRTFILDYAGGAASRAIKLRDSALKLHRG